MMGLSILVPELSVNLTCVTQSWSHPVDAILLLMGSDQPRQVALGPRWSYNPRTFAGTDLQAGVDELGGGENAWEVRVTWSSSH